MINRSYVVNNGKIEILGLGIKSYRNQEIKDVVKLIEQKPSFFSSTILENVKMGKNISNEEVVEALKKSDAYEFIQKLKDGVNTKLQNNANNLSGGQKQRISVARAFIRRA